jgi:hypothetical protein
LLNFLKLKSESISANSQILNKTEIEKKIKLVGTLSTPTPTVESLVAEKTYKLYIGGKQTRPDTSTSRPIYFKDDKQNEKIYCLVADASRKDVRNAVEAANNSFRRLFNYNNNNYYY